MPVNRNWWARCGRTSLCRYCYKTYLASDSTVYFPAPIMIVASFAGNIFANISGRVPWEKILPMGWIQRQARPAEPPISRSEALASCTSQSRYRLDCSVAFADGKPAPHTKTAASLQIRALYRARLLDKGSTVPAAYLSGRDTRPLPRIVGFCSPRTRGGREVDILGLGSPCGSDEDQGGPNHY
jgi:hypothetical protein